MQTYEMQLSADQIVEETSDWPEDAVADLVDRILRAKYGEVDPSVDNAWHAEIGRRIADLETGKVKGIPLEGTLAKALPRLERVNGLVVASARHQGKNLSYIPAARMKATSLRQSTRRPCRDRIRY
jgi:Putative addiction module component